MGSLPTEGRESGSVSDEITSFQSLPVESDRANEPPEATPESMQAATQRKRDPNFLVRVFARRPCVILIVSLVFALALAGVGMVIGEFEVSADNDGWNSRGTSVANKAAQDSARQNLFARNRGQEEDYRRRRLLSTGDTTEDVVATQRRKLAQQPTSSNDEYSIPTDSGWQDLWSYYKAKNGGSNLLTVEALKGVCDYEVEVMALLEQRDLCRKDWSLGQKCYKPVSFVTLIREYLLQTPQYSGSPRSWLSCARVFAEVNQTSIDLLVGQYVQEANTQPDLIPHLYFNGFVGSDLVETGGKNETTLLKTIFPVRHEDVKDQLYDLHTSGSFKASSGLFSNAYDLRDGELQDMYLDDSLASDMIMACAASFVILFLIWFHTRSVFMAFIGIIQVALSFPCAFFAYKILFGLKFFPFLNFLALFVVMGIGADDIFVLFDKFEQAAQRMPEASVYEISCEAIPQASYAMLLTSATTAGAFFSTAITPVPPIRMFAIFLGTMTIFDYLFVLIICAPAMCLQLYWIKGTKDRGSHRGRYLKLSLLDYSECTCVKKRQSTNKKDTFSQWILVSATKFCVMLRYILVPCLLGLFVYFTLVSLDIPMPETSEVQLLPDSHMFTKANIKYKNDVFTIEQEETSWVNVIWGLKPGDTGDLNNPQSKSNVILDPEFKLGSPEGQLWMLQFCDEVAKQSFATSRGYCTMRNFDNWLKQEWDSQTNQRMTGLPLSEEEFTSKILEWRGYSDESQRHVGVTGEIAYDATNIGNNDPNHHQHHQMHEHNVGKVEFFVMSFESTVKWNDPYNKLKSKYYEWANFIETEMASAPAGLRNGFFNSEDFHWWDTNRQMKNSAYISALLSIGMATGVIFISNGNVILTLYSVVSIFCILVTVAATVVAMGWTLGFLEAICFAILVGLSCDFIVHIAHAYKESEAQTRRDKTLEAIWAMGPPVMFAALSTSLAGALLFTCNILFYVKFGAILMCTMAYSFLIIFVFLAPLLALAGPTGNCGEPFALFKKQCIK